MNREKQEQQAKQRQALLESKFTRQELKDLKKFDPVMARSFLTSAELEQSNPKPIKG